MDGAYGQFTDTEKWMKEQHVEELYEHFDVDLYEKARTMVSHLATFVKHRLTTASIRNGQVTATREAYPFTSM